MSLRNIDSDVWALEAPRDPSGLLPVRSAIFRLADGGLLVFSPIPGFGDHAAALRELGPVRGFVAPNVMHHLGLDDAREAFPGTPMFARASLQKKRGDLTFHALLGDAPDPLWAGDFDQVVIGGMPRLDEVAFFHRASRTVVLADLAFNVDRVEGWGRRLFMRLNGALGHFGPSRICKMLMADRAAVRKAIDQMVAWKPERVLMSHGDIIESGGAEALKQAFAFLG